MVGLLGLSQYKIIHIQSEILKNTYFLKFDETNHESTYKGTFIPIDLQS